MDIRCRAEGGIGRDQAYREFDAHARVLVFTMHSGGRLRSTGLPLLGQRGT